MVHSIHDSTVMAVQRPDGWYVGAAGPFETIHVATVAADASCVIASRKGDFRSVLVIDGKVRQEDCKCDLDFHGAAFAKTSDDRLLVRAWQPGGKGERHEFFVTKKSVHGPFIGTNPVKDFSEGAYLVHKANEEGKEFHRYLLLHDALHGPFQEIEGTTDATGARYLLCRVDKKRHDRIHVFSKKGLVGIYDGIRTDRKAALIASPSSLKDDTDVIFGGRVLHHHPAASVVEVYAVGRNLLQHVQHKDPKKGVSETLFLNATEVAGPYNSIDFLSVTEDGKLTYTATETDGLGNRSLRFCKGTLSTGF